MSIQSYLPYLLALLGAGVLHFLYRLYVHRRQFNDLPKPPHGFLFGHLGVMKDAIAANPPDVHPQQILTYISMKYGMKGVYYLDLWPLSDSQMVLDEPELMEAMQVTKVWDQHQAVNDAAEALVGINNLGAINGSMWKTLHNRLSPAFLPANLRGHYGAMIEETLHFRNTMTNFAKSGQVFSMEAEGAKLAFDIIGRLTFNSSMGVQTGGNSIYDDLVTIIHSTDGFNPINPLTKFMAGSKSAEAQKHIKATLEGKIHERLRELKDNNIVTTRRKFSSVLDLLLSERLTENTQGEKGQSASLSRVELDTLTSNIKGVFLGGQGTVAGTLSFVHMLLSKHPDVVTRLREEHETVFDKSLSKTIEILESSPAKLHDMVFTTAVIKETLRLFPIGLLFKQAPPGATIKWQNREYPAEGFVVIPNQHVLHYNPAYYPDPGQFKPERFLNDAVPRSWFRSFGRGARSCIGQNLAMDIMRINLLLTLRDWKFECHDLKPNVKPKMAYTGMDTMFGDIIFQLEDFEAKPRGGMMMTVKELDVVA